MNELTQLYNDYIQAFKTLSIDDKKKNTISELKKIITMIKEISDAMNLNIKLTLSPEMIDLNGIIITEDDYLEGIFAYINTLQILIGEVLEKLTIQQSGEGQEQMQ